MNRTVRSLLVLLVSLGLSCSGRESPDLVTSGTDGLETVAVMETDEGTIVVSFFSEQAPRHAENFARLCNAGYYDGTYFHRVAAGFMIQGGDPNTKDDEPSNDGKGGHGASGPGTTLEPEFNDIHHTRGIVSMSRTSDPASAGSQFFILLADDPSLDDQYTAFGRVVEGLEVVEAISEQPGEPYPIEGGVKPAEAQHVIACWIEQRPTT